MSLLRRLRTLFRRRDLEAEMAEEMRFHLEQRAADYTADGLNATDAALAAQRRFGNTASIQEQAREAHGWGGLERASKDLRFAFRQLAGSPGFTLLAVLTLGLGIGANTAMFSMFNGLVWKPLPYVDNDRLMRVYRGTPQNAMGNLSAADYLELQRAQGGFGTMAGYTPAEVSLSDPGQPAEFAYAARSSANLFSLLGVTPQLGRDFRPGEDVPGGNRVVILSQRTWRKRYGGDPDIVGRTIRIDGEPHEVVGVLPQSFNDWRHLGMMDFFRPLALTAGESVDRAGTRMRAILRRAPEHSREETAGLVASLGARLAAEFPEANAETTWKAIPLQDSTAPKRAAPMLGMMVALSALVLLIACSNLANLLLARTMARTREFAVRAALGASRLQLLRPLIAESLLLALAGGACAVLVALWFRDYMAVRSIGDNGEGVFVEIGWQTFGWALGASLVTAVAFGTMPALFALRLDLNPTLKSGGRGMTGSRGHQRFRQLLIVGQFAIAMVLLAASGFQIRGLQQLNERRAGWESGNLVTGEILLPAGTYADAHKISAFHRLLLERLEALPGVAAASVSSYTPFFNWTDARKFVVASRARPPAGHEPAATVNVVSAGYFHTFGTRLLAGRAFGERDHATAPRVAIVSAATARALFGDENPLGQRLAQVSGANGGDLVWSEVIGVATDAVSTINEDNPISNETNQVYLPMTQEPRRANALAIRTADVAPLALVEDIRATIAKLDPDLPVGRLQHADRAIEHANYQVAVGRDIFATMAALGLGLAALGIYGVIARTMAQRTGEFAIRLALGASLANLTRLVLASGLKLAAAGCVLGFAGALLVVKALAMMNPKMPANGIEVSLGATLLLISVALLACWLPARRAASINAVDAMRAE